MPNLHDTNSKQVFQAISKEQHAVEFVRKYRKMKKSNFFNDN